MKVAISAMGTAMKTNRSITAMLALFGQNPYLSGGFKEPLNV
jgi:hypothetical protein